MKKFLMILCAAVMVCATAACGNSAAPDPEASAGSSLSVESNAAAASAAQSRQPIKPDEPLVIRVATSYADLDHIHDELREAAERVAQRTNGAIQLEIYPNSSMTSFANAVKAVKSDAALIYMCSFAEWVDYYPDAAALQSGFVFNSAEALRRFYESEIVDEVIAEMDKVNIHCVAPGFTSGMRHLLCDKQITCIEDLKGMKFRTPPVVTWTDLFNSLGAEAVGMAWSDTVSALADGNLDGCCQSIPLIYSTKSYEMFKECTLTAHMPVSDHLWCSANFWYRIDEEYRTIMEEELKAAASDYTRYCKENEWKQIEELEAAGVHFYEVDRTPFIEAAQKNVLQYSIGQRVLDAVAKIDAEIAAEQSSKAENGQ